MFAYECESEAVKGILHSAACDQKTDQAASSHTNTQTRTRPPKRIGEGASCKSFCLST
jgi:hypothetical protein